jgi:hypothetical protein
VCLSLSDIKIFDISLSVIAYQVLLKDITVEKSLNNVDVIYILEDRASDQVFQFHIPKSTSSSSRWIRAFDQEVPGHDIPYSEKGRNVAYSSTTPMRNLQNESLSTYRRDEDGGSTISSFDLVGIKLLTSASAQKRSEPKVLEPVFAHEFDSSSIPNEF